MFDGIQWLAGRERLYAGLQPWFAAVAGSVLDVGGGTGALAAILPRRAREVCLDLDPLKLSRYRRKFRRGLAIRADAASLPIVSGTMNGAALVGVCHHLRDAALDSVLAEIARVLRPDRCLVLLEPLLVPGRLVSSFLWRLDRGAHPRTREELLPMIERHFRIIEGRTSALWHHRYLSCLLLPISRSTSSGEGQELVRSSAGEVAGLPISARRPRNPDM